MGPKPPSVNTCQETRWKAISGLLASLLRNDVGFCLSRNHRHLSVLGPQLQQIPESPSSLLSRYFARRHWGHQSRCWWEEVVHPPVLMAHLFNLLWPHIHSLLFIGHTFILSSLLPMPGRDVVPSTKVEKNVKGSTLWSSVASCLAVQELHPAGPSALKCATHPKFP